MVRLYCLSLPICGLLACASQEGFVNRFVGWANDAGEPLRSYTTGLLAAAVEVQDIAGYLKESNARLVSTILNNFTEILIKYQLGGGGGVMNDPQWAAVHKFEYVGLNWSAIVFVSTNVMALFIHTLFDEGKFMPYFIYNIFLLHKKKKTGRQNNIYTVHNFSLKRMGKMICATTWF